MEENTRASEIDEAFERFDRENRDVWQYFEHFAMLLIRSGRQRCSAKLLVERVRWETMISGGEPYKINNNFTSRYARKFARLYPEHRSFFRTRELTSEHKGARGWNQNR